MAHVEALLPAAAAEPPASARWSIPNLFLGMVIKPRETLAYLREHGGHTWIWPALAAIILTLASQAVIGPIQQAQMAARQAQMQQSTSSESSDTLEVQAATTSPLNEYGLPVGLLAGGWLVRAGLLFGLSALFGGKGTLGAIGRMSVWTTLPDTARTLVVTMVSAVTGTVSVSGLAFLGQAFGPATTGQTGVTVSSFFGLFLSELLGSLDIYTVWGLILLGLGMAITARLSTVKSIIATGSFWLISLALTVAPQMLGVGLGRLLGGSSGLPGGGPSGVGGAPAGGGAPPSGGAPAP